MLVQMGYASRGLSKFEYLLLKSLKRNTWAVVPNSKDIEVPAVLMGREINVNDLWSVGRSYLLGRNASSLYSHLVLGGIFVSALLAQRYYFRKQLKVKDEELTRLGLWKTEHQEKQIGAVLHHSQEK